MNVYTDSYRTRDKYGRSVTHFTVNSRTVVVLVKLPKLSEREYLLNDWASEKQGDITYFDKRKPGVKHAEQIVAREVAKMKEREASGMVMTTNGLITREEYEEKVAQGRIVRMDLDA